MRHLVEDLHSIELYVQDMEFRNLLPTTIDVRRRYLQKFAREVGFAEATEQNVVKWLSRPLSPKTRSMWLSTLNSFYKFALKGREGKPIYLPDADGVAHNPVADITKPRSHPRQPRPMPGEDLKRALENADPQMKCFLLLGALAGCRCQEIAFIAREDIFEAEASLRITHGKGAKERWVPLHPDIVAALKELPMPESGRLWDETAASMSRKINRYLHRLDIKPTAHTLRHWYATQSYQSCKDLRLVQTLLGHSSPSTTAIYAAADTRQAQGVVMGLRI
jgi:integrase